MLPDIVERIHKRMRATRQTASAASLKAGLSVSAIRNLERAVANGKRDAGIRSSSAVGLAAALNTSVEWLLEGRGPEVAGEAAATSEPRSVDDTFYDWIEANLRREGFDQAGLAAAWGIDRSGISRQLAARPALRIERVLKCAEYFGVAPPGFGATGEGGVIVEETLETGVFRERTERSRRTVAADPDPDHPASVQTAFEFIGLAFHDPDCRTVLSGDIVICIPVIDLGGVDGVVDGTLVVVRRRVEENVYEHSLRKLARKEGMLVFESHVSGRSYKPIVKRAEELGDDVAVIGVARRVLGRLHAI